MIPVFRVMLAILGEGVNDWGGAGRDHWVTASALFLALPGGYLDACFGLVY